ncbi:MAG: cupin domain-containing protein [Leptospiraceae bacterium]|nr:cupin domain-containing protein [Leptospiraceae bacterium]MBK7056981.1 cupin domain-containing protein [Leptospiraceae bacterium]MBK9501290.1 cupin domain-containing protein [Leptospiraceae bacterium]MBL0263395.1 cupin domain-containing protein [Leptospiraceae bacterium]MBP9163848.1 cupin domain-containing protein [Leptospiraceae bacterium]
MDILSEIINDSRWKGNLLARNSFYKPWGLKFPCEKSAGFHIVTQGKCFVRYKSKSILLTKGDIVFMARGFIHELASHENQKAMDIKKFKEIAEEILENRNPITSFLSVRYEIGNAPMHPFFLELPDVILIRSDEIPTHHPLQTTLVLISQELDRGIGSDILLQKLSDILLYYVIRHWMETHPSETPGWLSALKDDKILLALESLHLHHSKGWTIESLAGRVGISRATLANRFKETLGSSPMEYLARLRIEKGKQLLADDRMSLEEVARAVGYSSAFAFSKAYKRIQGFSPIQHRDIQWKKGS